MADAKEGIIRRRLRCVNFRYGWKRNHLGCGFPSFRYSEVFAKKEKAVRLDRHKEAKGGETQG